MTSIFDTENAIHAVPACEGPRRLQPRGVPQGARPPLELRQGEQTIPNRLVRISIRFIFDIVAAVWFDQKLRSHWHIWNWMSLHTCSLFGDTLLIKSNVVQSLTLLEVETVSPTVSRNDPDSWSETAQVGFLFFRWHDRHAKCMHRFDVVRPVLVGWFDFFVRELTLA